jgi:AcrR family transcriptional regulator
MDDVRPYRSDLRRLQAERTRRQIRKAARNLFEVNGFAATTIAQIAREAGVAPQTVYAVFESKGGLLLAMLEDLEEVGEQEAWAEKIRAAEDPHRQLRLYAAFNRTMFERGATILRAMMAARGAAEVAGATEQGDRNRREGTRHLVEAIAGRGLLRPGLEPEDAADRLWLLSSPEQYLNATDGAGWSPDRYERWLAELLQRELLATA